MSAVALQSFGFGDRKVRVIDRGGDFWFAANDVCAALELSCGRTSVAKLDDDEKGVHTMHTLGGVQSLATVSESGVYALIFKSRKAVAVTFRKWVTQEVLPALRKTGAYQMAAPPMVLADRDEGLDPRSSLFAERLAVGLQLVREARRTFGLKAAQPAWVLAALPDVGEQVFRRTSVRELPASVLRWIEDRLDEAPGHWEDGSVLYADYLAYCREFDFDPQVGKNFGLDLNAAGFAKRRSGRVRYLNIRLK